VLYRDGISIAALVGGEVTPLIELSAAELQQARQVLLRHAPAPTASSAPMAR
jgi:ATP-dependent Lhr-like helicase